MSDRKTAPSIDALWDTFQAANTFVHLFRYDQQLRWHIAADDWAILRLRSSGSTPIVRHTIEGDDYLFDVPVDVVAPGPWPELVIVCDRRN